MVISILLRTAAAHGWLVVRIAGVKPNVLVKILAGNIKDIRGRIDFGCARFDFDPIVEVRRECHPIATHCSG